MTIAACYVSPEGIVFGADSTASSFAPPFGLHYFNHNQKIFEVGKDSTIAVVTWGLASIGTQSLRTLVADFADFLFGESPNSMEDVAALFGAKISEAYLCEHKTDIDRVAQLMSKFPFDAKKILDPNHRSGAEEQELVARRMTTTLGFCIGGYLLHDRRPRAFEVILDPTNAGIAAIDEIPVTKNRFYGAPKIFKRIINGYDDDLIDDIIKSGMWNGNKEELTKLLDKHELKHGILPIREAVDFLFVCIQATIKAIKFSTMPQTCGGPIELAVITSDRNFRWIRHKEWSSAVDEGHRI